MNEISEVEDEIQRVVQEIGFLREKVKEYKIQRQKLILELKEINEKKRELLEKIRTFKQKLRDISDKRRKLIEELRALISEKRSKVEELRTLRELIAEKKLTIQEMSKESRTPIGVIREEIEKLEWKIQTSVLPLEEENKILGKIKALTSLLEKAERLQKEKNNVLELRALYTSTSLQLREINEKINRLKSELSELTRNRDKVKEDLKKLVSEYMALKAAKGEKQEYVDKYSNEIRVHTERLEELRNKLNDLQRTLEMIKTKQAVEAKRQEILSKMKNRDKKRLSIDELKIMYGEVEDFMENN